MNGLEILQRLAKSESTDENDDVMMQTILRHVGFKQARVVCGIVYLKGHGTIDAPPASIKQVANNILRSLP